MTWLRASSAVVGVTALLEVSQEATQRDGQLGSWEQGRLEADHDRPAECLGPPVADLDGDRDRTVELLEAATGSVSRPPVRPRSARNARPVGHLAARARSRACSTRSLASRAVAARMIAGTVGLEDVEKQVIGLVFADRIGAPEAVDGLVEVTLVELDHARGSSRRRPSCRR